MDNNTSSSISERCMQNPPEGITKVLGDVVFDNKQALPRRVVGLEVLVETIQEKLEKYTRVGIWGTGGQGKTVLAKAVFNQLNPKFDYSCFVSEVKLLKGVGEDVKKKVSKCMHYHGKQVSNGWSISELRGKHLLLVLDDVDKDKDLEIISILGDLARTVWCIVTSRNRSLLENLDLKFDIYEMPFLSEENSRQLFISHAFFDGVVKGVSDEQVEAIVSQCSGLSLSLVVLGKYLSYQKKLVWEYALEALKDASNVTTLDERLWMSLRVSYNGLGWVEQQMFLDATTFFQEGSSDRWTLGDAKGAWSAIYGDEEMRWRTLVNLSLVYDVDEDELISVHEQLRSLGRKIALEDARGGKPMRVWDPSVACDFFKSSLPNDQEIHSLIRKSNDEDVYSPRNLFGRLKNVQYLDVGTEAVSPFNPSQIVNWTLPREKLALLRCCFDQCLVGPPFRHLAVLHLELPDHGYNENDLSNFFARMPPLKILTLSALTSVPDEIGFLPQLKRLKFANGKFRQLPDMLVGGPLRQTLEHLEFDYCEDLVTLPDSFGKLSALTYLSFNRGSFLILPESFGDLLKLKCLFFGDCNLQRLPESFGSLFSLQNLSFHHCKNLQTLPESFGSLLSLTRLSFFTCHGLHTLPSIEIFRFLKNLESLEIDGWSQCPSLPHICQWLSVTCPLGS